MACCSCDDHDYCCRCSTEEERTRSILWDVLTGRYDGEVDTMEGRYLPDTIATVAATNIMLVLQRENLV